MKLSMGIAGRLSLSFVILALLAQWLSFQSAGELRREAVHLNEINKVKLVARVISPQLGRDRQRATLVAQLLQSELPNHWQDRSGLTGAAVAEHLNRSFRQSGIDVLEVTNAKGIVIHRAQEPGRTGDLATAWGIEEALAGKGSIVSIKRDRGVLILAIEPIRVNNQVVGTVSAGTLIAERFMQSLSIELGVDLALLARSGEVVASSQSGQMAVEAAAVNEAFQKKIPIFRTDVASRTAMVYLPVLIVDEAWVILARLDSSASYALLAQGDHQAATLNLMLLLGLILTTWVVLRFALQPLHLLRKKAQGTVLDLTGKPATITSGDDVRSLVEVLDAMTEALLQRNRQLEAQRGDLAVEVERSQTAEQAVKQLAFYDALTQLPNRRLLLDRMAQALGASQRNRHHGALLFLDLDNFKTLNDTLGHDMGDLLLQIVARRLLAVVREGDTVARLGGDEFVVMLEDLSEKVDEAVTQAETVGRKMLDALNQTYPLAGSDYRSTPSIGVTLFLGQQENLEELLKRADMAMYQAKSAGRNTLCFFDPQMQAAVAARAALEKDLRTALTEQQFVLHYQPQIGDGTCITGVEALVRWQHPQRGMVPPNAFIGLAEETGLILPLGQWVLETACLQLTRWASQPALAHLTMAVNVSARQFRQADFVDQVGVVMARTGVNPRRLKLELTESLLIADMDNVIAKMTALREQGVGFSLDDFGTGYSSLSYLKLLPLDQLKIDQSFVRDLLVDPNDAAIAKMVIALAESLGLAVIAEGVETEAQRDFLQDQGCHAFQGYYFSRPLPLDQLEAFALREPHRVAEQQV